MQAAAEKLAASATVRSASAPASTRPGAPPASGYDRKGIACESLAAISSQ
jgi:hypothetical protein